MKFFKLLCFLLLTGSAVFSQSVVPIRGDTLKVGTKSHPMELTLLNKTKDTAGFAINAGQGVLEFAAPVRVNDSTINIGGLVIVFGVPTGGSGIDTIFLGGIDTVFVISVGTAVGSIETVFPIAGNLYVSNWGPGYGWAPFLAGDSLAFGAVDTACSSCPASKDYVDARVGATAGSTRFGVSGEDDAATANRSFDGAGHDFTISQASLLDLKYTNGTRRTEIFLEDGDADIYAVATSVKYASVIYDAFGTSVIQDARDGTTANIKHSGILNDVTFLEFSSEESSPFVSDKLTLYPDHFQWTTLQSTSMIQGDLILGGFNGSVNCGILIEDASLNLLDVRDASAIFEVKTQGSARGALLPRMSTTSRNSISSPAEGLIVYDNTLHKLYVYDGTTWQAAW